MVILPEDNYGSLKEKLANISAELLIEIIPAIKDNSLTERPQDENLASYTHKFSKKDFWINWDNKIKNIFNQIRAFSPSPGARTSIHNTNLKILQAEIYDSSKNDKPGTIAGFIKNKGILVNCQDGQLLITRIQAEGKKVMSAWAFQLGARHTAGKVLSLLIKSLLKILTGRNYERPRPLPLSYKVSRFCKHQSFNY